MYIGKNAIWDAVPFLALWGSATQNARKMDVRCRSVPSDLHCSVPQCQCRCGTASFNKKVCAPALNRCRCRTNTNRDPVTSACCLLVTQQRDVLSSLGRRRTVKSCPRGDERFLTSCRVVSNVRRSSGRHSSVGIAVRYGLDGPGIESRWEAKFFAPALGPTLPPAQWTPGLFPGCKGAGE